MEVDPFFLESDRFFDKEVPTLGKQKISYTEVSLYNTLHAQFSKEDSPAPPKSSPSLFLQTLAEMFNRAMGDKYSIPAVLILLGVLLLLIQASK